MIKSIAFILLCSILNCSQIAKSVVDPVARVDQPMDIFDVISDYKKQQVHVKNDIDFLNQAAELCDDAKKQAEDIKNS